MNSLYLGNLIIGSLFRFFSPYFSTATRPTQFLLTWLVIAHEHPLHQTLRLMHAIPADLAGYRSVSPAGLPVPSLSSPEFLVPSNASLLEQLLPGASE